MTLDELKEEAKKLGYRLTPIRKKETLKPCICGCFKPNKWHMEGGVKYRCPMCKRETAVHRYNIYAIQEWNQLVGLEKEE